MSRIRVLRTSRGRMAFIKIKGHIKLWVIFVLSLVFQESFVECRGGRVRFRAAGGGAGAATDLWWIGLVAGIGVVIIMVIIIVILRWYYHKHGRYCCGTTPPSSNGVTS